jgi:hypothetical protein
MHGDTWHKSRHAAVVKLDAPLFLTSADSFLSRNPQYQLLVLGYVKLCDTYHRRRS